MLSGRKPSVSNVEREIDLYGQTPSDSREERAVTTYRKIDADEAGTDVGIRVN